MAGVVSATSAGAALPAAVAALAAGIPAALWAARTAPVPGAGEAAGRAGLGADTLAGLRTLLLLPRLRTATFSTTAGYLGLGMAFVATPLVAVEEGASRTRPVSSWPACPWARCSASPR